MIIMAIDLGKVRTGLAICDKSEMLASPLCVIEEKDDLKLIEKIGVIVAEKKPELIVVGLPKNMDSSEGESAIRCKELGEKISLKTDVCVIMRDERLTTVSAHSFLNNTNTRGKKRKAVVDSVAATIILQDYMDYRRLHKD